MNEIHDAVAKLLPPDIGAVYKEQQRQRDERERALMETVRATCLDAMDGLVSALRHPRISKEVLEEAILKLTCAHAAAKELDK